MDGTEDISTSLLNLTCIKKYLQPFLFVVLNEMQPEKIVLKEGFNCSGRR
jgi:hypothetical protein